MLLIFMKHDTLKINLEALGLTGYETKVYDAVIKLGKASAPTISQQSGVPYGQIYNTLQSLVSRGLVRIIPEKSKMFAPANPDELNKIIEEKKKALDELKKDIKRHRETFPQASEQKVFVVEGERNFWKADKLLGHAKKYNYNMTYNFKLSEKDKEKVAYEALKKKYHNVDMKALDNYNKNTVPYLNDFVKLSPRCKRRKFPFRNEGIAGRIYDDETVMLAIINANTTIVIKDKAFAKMMKQFFLNTWEKAEKI